MTCSNLTVDGRWVQPCKSMTHIGGKLISLPSLPNIGPGAQGRSERFWDRISYNLHHRFTRHSPSNVHEGPLKRPAMYLKIGLKSGMFWISKTQSPSRTDVSRCHDVTVGNTTQN